MKEKFELFHFNDIKNTGHRMSFKPFAQGQRKSRIIAIRVKKFLEDHISMTQYEEILKEFSKDLEIKENKIVLKIR